MIEWGFDSSGRYRLDSRQHYANYRGSPANMKAGVDRLALCLALGGITSGLALAVLIVLVLLKHVHPIPWYDRSYFAYMRRSLCADKIRCRFVKTIGPIRVGASGVIRGSISLIIPATLKSVKRRAHEQRRDKDHT